MGQIPILIGVKTLTKLGAILDVVGQWMVLSRVCLGLKVPLRRHLLVDLTNDWMVSGKPLPDVQTLSLFCTSRIQPRQRTWCMHGEGEAVTDLYACEVMVCGLEDEGQVQVLEGDGNQVLWAGAQLSDPNSENPMATEKNYGKSKGKEKKMMNMVPPEEKYDSARMQGPDPRDERCVGAPCFGAHIPARPGPGSVSGSNKYATWTAEPSSLSSPSPSCSSPRSPPA